MSIQYVWRKLFVLIATLATVSACASSEPQTVATADATVTMDTLVTTQWLSEHLDDPDLVVLDCTVLIEQNEDGSMQSVSGRASYEGGHIPNAGFADLRGDLCDGENPNEYQR